MAWNRYESWLSHEWGSCLTTDPDEPSVQRFLEQHPSLLPGASDDVGQGGHHGAWWDAVITQPELKGLGPSRWPDFMWVRRDTNSTKPILIEIESPRKRWYNQNLVLNANVTQAIDQLDEWRTWFDNDENRLIFKRAYVPARFNSRFLQPEYVLIYGRSAEFRRDGPHADYERARHKRDQLRRHDVHMYTFDMLRPRYEAASYATIRRRRQRFEIETIPPTFSTGSYLLREGTLLDAATDIDNALDSTHLVEDGRREYLRTRWNYWKREDVEYSQHRGPTDMCFE